jgi:hypothetical protein
MRKTVRDELTELSKQVVQLQFQLSFGSAEIEAETPARAAAYQRQLCCLRGNV